MAQALSSDNSNNDSNVLMAGSPHHSEMDITFTGFLQYKPPFDEPTLELEYELDYSLNVVIDTFKSMVFEDIENLPEQLKGIWPCFCLSLLFQTSLTEHSPHQIWPNSVNAV